MSKVLLGDVARERRETCKSSKDGYPVVGLEHLTPEEITLSAWDEEKENTFTKLFRKGDILFGRRRAYLKKAAVAPFDGICSGDITVIEAIPEKILPELLPFIIQNDALFDFAVGKSAGSLSPRVKWEHLRNYSFELPDMEEQRRLAKVLWAMDATKKAYQKLIRKTDELVKSQFIALFGDPTTNPLGWELVRLEDLCSSIVRGPFGSALKVSYFVPKTENTIKVYEQKNAIQSSADLGTSYITQEKYEELLRFRCGPGDILMSCSGTIGCLYQLPENAEPGIINQALCKFRLNDRILPIVFLTFMRQSVNQLETKGTGIQNIGAVSYIKDMKIPLAPRNVQEQFAAFVQQSDKSKFELEQALAELTATYKRIIAENLG